MGYTTEAKVQSMFRAIEFAAATGDEQTETAVTQEDVAEFILEADAEIDSKLTKFYEVPITGAEALKIVGQISKYKVSHVIKTILESTTQTSDHNQEVQINLELKANKLLDDIVPHWDKKCCEWVDPAMTLTDAVTKPRSPVTGSVFSSASHTAEIKRGGDNW